MRSSKSAVYNRMATALFDAEEILETIESQKRHERPELPKAPVAPRTPTEEFLAEMWRQVLGVDRVGVEDRFFDLGGHSLLANQVLSRLLDAFEVELSIESFFEKPTVAGLAEQVEAARQRAAGVTAPPIRRLARRDSLPLPLSFAQQRLWFLDRLRPGSVAYNISVAVRLVGKLEPRVLEAAFQELVIRHEPLRTVFAVRDGRAVQLVHPARRHRLTTTDLTGLSVLEREVRARQLARDEAAIPFDLTVGPLLRTRLLKLSQEEHLIVLAMHHILSDGWSMGIMVRELGALYRAFLAGQPSPLAELPIQYADFASWQREWLRGDILEAHLSYFRDELTGAPAVLELPTDRPRSRGFSDRGARRPLRLSRDVSERLSVVSRRAGCTMFMTLLAAFSELLRRLSNQDDLVVGSMIANRNRRELESLIGFFVNTLVLRIDLAGAPTFRDLLVRVRRVALGAFAHQDLPFDKVVEELHPERDVAVSPLFQVVFQLHNAPPVELEVPGLKLQVVPFAENSVMFDLILNLMETGSGLEGHWHYSSALFDETTIARMSRQLTTLLEGVAAGIDELASELPLLSAPERHQLTMEWNAPKTATRRPLSLPDLHERQAARRPDAVAVVFEEKSLTYCELNRRANRLARALRELGVGTGVSVGLYVERSLELVVGILGILKAGGAYVPLETAHPTERLAFVLEDSGTSLVVVDDGSRGAAAGLPDGMRIVDLARDRDWIAREAEANLSVVVDPDDLAYVIYTSGSAGRPKGVRVSHGNVARLFSTTVEWFQFGVRDVWTLFHSYAFDFSVWELWGALLRGGRLVVVPYWISRSPERFYELLRRERVTVVNQTPSAFGQLVRAVEAASEGPAVKPPLRWVIFGGEALDPKSLTPWMARFGERFPRLVNMYGITETTVHVTWRLLSQRDLEVGSCRIGRALPDLSLYLLGSGYRPVPLGVPGEIHVGGAGVSQGYLGRPGWTAERFLPDDFGPAQASLPRGARLYRSGDLARYRPDGDLEYLGRIDHQVQIRGFRVELAEIEAALRRHPRVRDAVVLMLESEIGGGEHVTLQQRLVAYVVSRSETRPSMSDLRRFLSESLPEHMLPAVTIHLDALPLTPNGKVDRAALPLPGNERPELTSDYIAPRTPLERFLAAIWSEKLEVEDIGLHDNFFELGGNSISGALVINHLQEELREIVPVVVIFDTPTIEELAAYLVSLHPRAVERRWGSPALGEAGSTARAPHGATRTEDDDSSTTRWIEPVERAPGTRMPLSFAQQRLWFLHLLDPRSAAYNVFAAVRLEGRLDLGVLVASFNEIVRRHEVLRTSFRAEAGDPYQVVEPSVSVRIPVLDLSSLFESQAEVQIRRLAFAEGRRPFDLARAPMLRVTVMALNERKHVVLLSMHHIASDAWSMGILVDELKTLYDVFSRGEPSPLPELEVQYADFAHWQRRWLSGETLQRQLSYWRRQLWQLPAAIELPTARPGSAVKDHVGARYSFVLSAELDAEVRRLSREEKTTVFVTLLGAFNLLLSHLADRSDVVVGADISGRNRREIEGLIGFFINMLVIRTDLTGDPSFRELLRREQEVVMGALKNQDVPYEQLVAELRSGRKSNRDSLFDVVFNFNNTPVQRSTATLGESGPVLRGLDLEEELVRFDLMLMVSDQGGNLSGAWFYATRLFGEDAVARMHSQYETILRQAVTNPEMTTSEVDLQSEAEIREKIVAEKAEKASKLTKFRNVKPRLIQSQ